MVNIQLPVRKRRFFANCANTVLTGQQSIVLFWSYSMPSCFRFPIMLFNARIIALFPARRVVFPFLYGFWRFTLSTQRFFSYLCIWLTCDVPRSPRWQSVRIQAHDGRTPRCALKQCRSGRLLFTRYAASHWRFMEVRLLPKGFRMQAIFWRRCGPGDSFCCPRYPLKV
jgi:hypothetical protein